MLASQEPWTPPFVLQLVGEYVIDIIRRIADRVDELPLELYTRFAAENSEFLNLTRQRVVSYWQRYYRFLFPRLITYPAVQLLNALGLWGDHAMRLLVAR